MRSIEILGTIIVPVDWLRQRACDTTHAGLHERTVFIIFKRHRDGKSCIGTRRDVQRSMRGGRYVIVRNWNCSITRCELRDRCNCIAVDVAVGRGTPPSNLAFSVKPTRFLNPQ